MAETASGAGEKDFLHPLEKADESRLAVSAALLLDRLQIQQDFFKTLKIKNILKTSFPSPPCTRVHVHTSQVVEVIVVIVIVVVVIGIDAADDINDSVDADTGKSQEAEW